MGFTVKKKRVLRRVKVVSSRCLERPLGVRPIIVEDLELKGWKRPPPPRFQLY